VLSTEKQHIHPEWQSDKLITPKWKC